MHAFLDNDSRGSRFTRDVKISTAPLATAKQVDYINGLIRNAFGPTDKTKVYQVIVETALDKGTLTIPRASEMITHLKAFPRYIAVVEPEPTVAPIIPPPPARPDALASGMFKLAHGFYAVQDTDRVRFFRIDTPTVGKWMGFVFVKEQASDDLHPVGTLKPGALTYRGRYPKLMEAIVAEPQAALTMYGQTIGRCYVCGRTLTDETSRQLGVGPVCRGERLE